MDVEDWIEDEEGKGFSESQVRKSLEDKGWKDSDITKAIWKLRFKRAFRPSWKKLLLPMILLVFLFFSHAVNIAYMPEAGESICHINEQLKVWESKDNEVDEAVHKFNISAEESFKQWREREKINDKFSKDFHERTVNAFPLFIGNSFLLSNIQYLNPFYPASCVATGMVPSPACRYYISEESYDCLTERIEAETGGIGLLGGFYQGAPPYKPISHLYWFFNAVLLVGIFYALQSLGLLIFEYFHDKEIKSRFFFAIILLLILFLTDFFIGLDQDYFIIYLIIISLYSVSLVVPEKWPSRLFLVTIVLGIVAGIWISGFLWSHATGKGEESGEIDSLVYCNNSKVLNDSQAYFGKDKHTGEKLKLCRNPGCEDICRGKGEFCRSRAEINAERPACICSCIEKD